jgi:hypothetical protein
MRVRVGCRTDHAMGRLQARHSSTNRIRTMKTDTQLQQGVTAELK